MKRWRGTMPPKYQMEIVPGFFIGARGGVRPNWWWRTMQWLAFGFRWRRWPLTAYNGSEGEAP